MGFGGLGGFYKCMKYTLAAFNILVLLIGAAALGLGIYIYVGDHGLKDYAIILGDYAYEAGTFLLIAIGCVTIIISFLGCCGAIMESRCMLGIYFAIMLILSIFFIVIIILGFVFKDQIADEMQAAAKETLENDYGNDTAVTNTWNALQEDLKCCGLKGDVNSNTSWAFYKLRTSWYIRQPASGSGRKFVPFSCCKPDVNLEECARGQNNTKIPRAGPPLSETIFTNEELYTDGCFDKLDDFLEDNALIILGIGFGALFIMLIGTIFSICLCVQIGKEGYVV